MANKTLYISDLDGTLLNNEKEVSECTKSTINRLVADGMHFSIATARTAATAVKIMSGLNICEPVVLMNGAVIYDICSGKYIKIEVMPTFTVNSVIGILKEYGIYGFMYTINDDILVTYYENLNTKALKDFHDERVYIYNKRYEQVENFLSKTEDSNVVYFALLDEYERLSLILDKLKSFSDIDMVLYKCIYTENSWFLEIFSKNASKYNAVKYLREHYKYDRIIGFGDNYNDISLLKACDEFYAVSNAVDELKAMSAGVIDDNKSDSVAKFLAKKFPECS